MEPVQAWKCFTMAGSVWYSQSLIQNASGQEASAKSLARSTTVAQALYFTIWKSTCELRLEMDVPGIFDNVDLPHDFRLAPTPSPGLLSGGSGSDDDERYWYYYLVEIAARHQINHVASTMVWRGTPTTSATRRMVNLAETLERSVHGWHAPLPTVFAFEVPMGGDVTPHIDDLTQILRHRYLCCRELIGRSFVRLCVGAPFVLDRKPALKARILYFVSVGLPFCMLKLPEIAPHQHHGTWFRLRDAAISIVLLCSVSLAQERSNSHDLHQLKLPDGWQAKALNTADVLRPYRSDHRGGISNVGWIMQRILFEVTKGAQGQT